MIAGWQIKPLGEICEFQRGLTYGKSDEVDVSENIVLRANNINLASHTLDFSELRYIANSVPIPASKKLRRGSLIICTASGSKSHLGKVAFVDEDYGYAFGGFMGQITPIGTIDARYLFHVLTSPTYKGFVDALSDGLNINNLKFDDLRQFPVPVPPISEQRRIVAILDEAFEAITTAKENVEKNLQSAGELFESQREILLCFSDGWKEAPLSDLCDIKHGYAFEGEFFASAGDYVLLTPGNYFEAGGYRDRGDKQKYFTGQIPVDYILTEGSLLVAMTEQAAGLLGSPLLVPESDRFLHNQRLGLVIAKSGVAWVNDFFFHVFNLTRVRSDIHSSASGVKVRHTSPSKIGAVRVAYPSTVAEQREVAEKLFGIAAHCDQLAAIYENKLAALDALKKSLQHQAFTGQFTANKAEDMVEAAA